MPAAVLLKTSKIKSSTEKQSPDIIVHEAKRTATSTRTTHTAEQSLPACFGAGGSNRSTRPLLSSSNGARSCRNRLRCLLLYSSKKQKKQKQPTYRYLRFTLNNIFREGLASEKGECSQNSGSGPHILGSNPHTKIKLTKPEILEQYDNLVLVHLLVAVGSGLWTMMADCFSVDDFILDVFSNTAAGTAREYDSYGHRRCWTAAASCPDYSCPHRAKPVRLVLPCVYCSRTRGCALWFVNDDGRALFFG